MAYHAKGLAITIATTTNFKKSLERRPTILVDEAPKILRIPISFTLVLSEDHLVINDHGAYDQKDGYAKLEYDQGIAQSSSFFCF